MFFCFLYQLPFYDIFLTIFFLLRIIDYNLLLERIYFYSFFLILQFYLLLLCYSIYDFSLIFLLLPPGILATFYVYGLKKTLIIVVLILSYIPLGEYIKSKYNIIPNAQSEISTVNGFIIFYAVTVFLFCIYFLINIKKIEAIVAFNENGNVDFNMFYFLNMKRNNKVNLLDDEIDTEYRKLFEKIEQLMKVEKVWLNPDYNVLQMSKDIGTNTLYVSQSINKFAKMNVRSYLNEFRINAFLNNIEEIKSGKISIKEAFCSSGFNSQSTFNRVFKNKFSMTPQEYLNNFIE